MIRWLALAAGLALAGPAAARVPPDQLAQVGVRAVPGAQLPMQAHFTDGSRRTLTLAEAVGGVPAVLVFADYRCPNVCGPALAIAASALKGAGLSPGRDYRLVVIGLRPGEPGKYVEAFRAAHLTAAPEVVQAAEFLTGDAQAVRAATAAAGYRYAYDPESAQFVHPVAAFVLTPTGRIARAFPEVAIARPELRDALVQARADKPAGLIEAIRVLCHGLDPASGVYDGAVQTGLRVGGVLMLAAFGGGAVMLARRRRAAP